MIQEHTRPSVQQVRSHQQTLRLAWTTLFIAFGIACALLLAVGYGLWHYRTTAMLPHRSVLFVHGPSEWVTWQRKGHTIFEQASNQQWVNEGDRINIARSAGYGQISTIRLFDFSTVDMWAGAEIALERVRTSRWNTRHQEIVFRQTDGYIRYDLLDTQPYQDVRFRVQLDTPAVVDLSPGGSYSIDITPPDRQVLIPSHVAVNPVVIDIAVRSGLARVSKGDTTVLLTAGERLIIEPSGEISTPRSALWNLIRDGSFRMYSEEEYNNTTVLNQPTLPRSHTWQVFGIYSGSRESSAPGYFRLSSGCHPPQKGNDCPPDEHIRSAWFIRGNNQTKSFTTGIIQQLGPDGGGVDISEYRSLVFSVWVRVLYQSLALTGDAGTECPIMIRFISKKHMPTDPEEERVICVYTREESDQEPVYAPGIIYYPVQRYEWFHLVIELRDPEWLPDTRYLRSVSIYANGHDYDSRATEIALIGSHYAPGVRVPDDVLRSEE